jgi:hypothetical protein
MNELEEIKNKIQDSETTAEEEEAKTSARRNCLEQMLLELRKRQNFLSE